MFQKISCIQLLVFLFLVINCSRTFFHAWSKKNTFLCFQSLFRKISCFLISLFLFKKKRSPQKKKPDSLDFFSLLFLLNLLTFFLCPLFLFALLVVTLLVLFFLHASSPFVCSLHVYWLSLMFLLIVFIPFFENFLNLYYLFFVVCWKSLIFELVISLCKTFLVLSFFCFDPFSDCFFDGVLSNKIKFTFFWKQKPLV